MKAFLSILVLLHAAVGAAELRTVEDLKSLIREKQISLLDQLIPNLPADMQKNLILVYDSHALNTYLVTPETPRMMFFNSDGSLVFTITRNPGIDAIRNGQDRLEVMSFNKAKSLFEMREITFDGTQPPQPDLLQNVNPTSCLSCHGQNPRPIFQDYNAWPGFYGSFSQDGLAKVGTQENNWLKKFLAEAKTKPRYADLYLGNFKQVSAGLIYEESEESETPAAQLGRKFESLMFSRISRKIFQDPRYEQIKPLIEYLGSQSASTCGSRAERLKSLFEKWNSQREVSRPAFDSLTLRLKQQITQDYQKKVAAFSLFNEVETSYYDARGVFSIPYFLGVLGKDPYYPVDAVFFRNQLLILETLFQYLNLDSADISTSPNMPTTGVFHIRAKTNGEENQNYFWGLADGLRAFDSKFQGNLVDCAESSKRALQSLTMIPIASSREHGVLFNNP